jgi:secreted protein with Ig-like and vWFA domain
LTGEKLALVKRAMGFVIDNLGAEDRLSVVAFDSDARRVIRLTRMTADGKAAAKRAVETLVAAGCTNIRGGLDVAAKVLDGRRHRNAVASVILLSDGQDNCSGGGGGFFHGPRRFGATIHDVLAPPSFMRAGGGDRCAPVHAFGFGTDHDAAAMHGISELTGGTFSFIEDHAAIRRRAEGARLRRVPAPLCAPLRGQVRPLREPRRRGGPHRHGGRG